MKAHPDLPALFRAVRRPARQARLLAAVLGLLVPVAALAQEASLSLNGTLHRVVVEKTGTTGTRLLHILQTPDGSSSTRVVPGTEDALPETAPWISAEPASSSRAALAWGRWDGSDFEIVTAIWDGARWSAITTLTNNSVNDSNPQLVWGRSGILHLMWREDGSTEPFFMHAQLDDGGRVTMGPSLVSVPPAEIVSESGGGDPGAAGAPKTSDILFAFVRPGPAPGGGMSLYGGRDAPMPIERRSDFTYGQGSISTIDRVEGSKAARRLLMMFRVPGRLIYTHRDSSTGWSPYRVITLGPDMSEDRAELTLRESLERAPCATP